VDLLLLSFSTELSSPPIKRFSTELMLANCGYPFPSLQEKYSSLLAMDDKTELQMLSFEAPKIRLLRSLCIEGSDGMQVQLYSISCYSQSLVSEEIFFIVQL